ncbi:DNA-3-methyladenine glycosidase [Dioszegia hungarica]|uniref:DNA-3-methyladenine glycosidase n=1 Tax=Dioszegia hungarica TaxID=4972 RepID=A0AA38LWY6_9TREE|nr:DNA-3-methyladenine glycosidase [Dioszegia hungarica]KAI9639357.1 DNA-3-methyladenine glycosidase [Dioszegia hungarica]
MAEDRSGADGGPVSDPPGGVQGDAKPKTTPRKKRAPAQPAGTPPPTRTLVPLHTAPALLPPVLPFSLPTAIAHLSSHDPRFGTLYTHIPPKPFSTLEAVDPFRTLVTSIIGQQVSWLAARAITKRFRMIWGHETEDGFPTPLEVSKGKVEDYRAAGFSQRKAEYVIAIAEHFVSGQISTELLKDGTDEEIAQALITVRGIGQWTVDMFLMFSLRRPDVLPVGDLGVQKGLLRWALTAHDALPESKKKTGKKADAVRAKYKKEAKTEIRTPPPEDRPQAPPTPYTPGTDASTIAALRTPASRQITHLPPTPVTPGMPTEEVLVKVEETLEVPALPAPTPEELMRPLVTHAQWDAFRAAPLEEGLSVEVLKARLAGKKVKGGAYLTPKEMEVLTEGWRPYRSIGVYYMWPAGEEF